jgi:murein DD-endopeptidase MepM/ murein hydrolase activator NlpD
MSSNGNKRKKSPVIKIIVLFIVLILGGIILLQSNGPSNPISKANIVIDFPLRGTWIAPNSPGTKVPSHGTNIFGERYAYDFVKINTANIVRKFYDAPVLGYMLFGVPLKKCYGWGAEIYAPCDGEIVMVEDGVQERANVNIFSDLRYVTSVSDKLKRGLFEYKDAAGNYIIMKCDVNLYALFAHLQNGSITVRKGEKVKKGQILGRVGHSGNSTAPHLHFQLMDNDDPKMANGIPCAFESYEIKNGGGWKRINAGIPTANDVIRR